MKPVFYGLTILSLAACSGPAPHGQPIPQTSASARTVVVPVRNATLRVQYDPAKSPTIATLTYVEQVAIADLLFINKEVTPALEHATGCQVAAPPAANNQLLPSEGRTLVPIRC